MEMRRVVEFLKTAESVGILSHTPPDGDNIRSSVCIKHSVKTNWKEQWNIF